MRGQGTVAVRAETVAIVLSTLRVDAQAGVLISMKRAEIRSAPSSWPGTIEAQQIGDVVGLIVPIDGDACAMLLPGWFGKWLRWRHQLRQAGAPILAVGVMQRGERAGGISVDVNHPIGEYEVAETSRVHMSRQR